MRKAREGSFDFPRSCIGFGHLNRNSTLQCRIWKIQILASEFGIAKCLLCRFGDAEQPSDGIGLGCLERLSFRQTAVEGAGRDHAKDLLRPEHAAIDEIPYFLCFDAANNLIMSKGALVLRKSGGRRSLPSSIRNLAHHWGRVLILRLQCSGASQMPQVLRQMATGVLLTPPSPSPAA